MYLVGNRVSGTEGLLTERKIGLMNTPKNGYTIQEGWVWAADNGCFGKGYPGDQKWIAWLDSFTPEQRSSCLFATAPDVVGDAKASLARSLPFLTRIRQLGYAPALVTQDGMTPDMVPWNDIDWLFIGGTNEHKLGPEAKALIDVAKQHGKRVHVGRVNSQRRFLAFAALNCDSADGTYLGFGPKANLPKLLGWLRHHETHDAMFTGAL